MERLFGLLDLLADADVHEALRDRGGEHGEAPWRGV